VKNILLTLLLFQNPLFSQIVTKIDTNNIIIGDHINFSIESEIKENEVWPIFKDSLGQLEIILKTKIDSTKTNDGWILKQNFTVTQWDSGFFKTPIIQIGNKKSQQYIITVNTIPIDQEKEFYDIKKPINIPLKFIEILPYILLFLIIVMIIIFTRKYLRNRKPEIKKPEIIEKIIPAYVTALDDLEKLKTEKKWQSGKIKDYYSDISDIIRIYIEDGLSTPAMEMLTKDIIHALKNKNINTENLNSLLNTADLAKYAKSKPSSNENELIMKIAIDFVHQTKNTNNDE
tara:strand:- start:2084 stop:2947 length:864 start_codon:yes stop_codon:yes gene_type:complete